MHHKKVPENRLGEIGWGVGKPENSRAEGEVAAERTYWVEVWCPSGKN